MDANDSYDVAVIGAGLAGLECGRRLCSAGLRVLMIDRKPDISRSVHTTGIFVRRTLEDFDLPESCLGPPIRQVVLHSPARRPLTLESPHDEFRVGRMGALYDRRLVECLNLGVHWSPSTRLTGIEGSENLSRVSISIRGRARTVSARYVVGADGVASATARALGLDTAAGSSARKTCSAVFPAAGRRAFTAFSIRIWLPATSPGSSTTARRLTWASAGRRAAST